MASSSCSPGDNSEKILPPPPLPVQTNHKQGFTEDDMAHRLQEGNEYEEGDKHWSLEVFGYY